MRLPPRRWTRPTRRVAAGSVCVLLVLLSVGCERLGRAYWLRKYERDAEAATRGLERAKRAGERATRLAERGRAYSDKGRYSRFAKCITLADYEGLFARAMQDHDQAIALAPEQSDVYLLRGWSYYDRATVIGLDGLESRGAEKPWLGHAQADFTRAIERDPRNVQAWDMRALIRSALGDRDGVIADLTAAVNIDFSERHRLAEAYCERGGARQGRKDVEGAVSDYEQSLALGATSDGCSCDPYAPLAAAYLDARQYDKSWSTVRRARAAKHWIPPDLVDKLTKASGRSE